METSCEHLCEKHIKIIKLHNLLSPNEFGKLVVGMVKMFKMISCRANDKYKSETGNSQLNPKSALHVFTHAITDMDNAQRLDVSRHFEDVLHKVVKV